MAPSHGASDTYPVEKICTTARLTLCERASICALKSCSESDRAAAGGWAKASVITAKKQIESFIAALMVNLRSGIERSVPQVGPRPANRSKPCGCHAIPIRLRGFRLQYKPGRGNRTGKIGRAHV